jgi:hypothetical protein
MLSKDTAYGVPPDILVELGNVWETVLGKDVDFPTGGNSGVKQQADFISPVKQPVNLENYARAGGTCNFLFSAGANQTFQFRSMMMRVFTFGAGTSHHFSPIRDLYHDLHSVMAEKDLLLVKSHATYHYECKAPYAGALINGVAKKFDTTRSGGPSMVNYRYEGDMQMSHVKVEDKKIKSLSRISMENNCINLQAHAFSFCHQSEALEPGLSPSIDDFEKGSIVLDKDGVGIRGEKVAMQDEQGQASIVIKRGNVDVEAMNFNFKGQKVSVG